MNTFKALFVAYCFVLLGLFLYSFTQIDLSLTFSRIVFLRHIVTSFQYIGYFNRPLSTFFYILLLVLLTVFHVIFLYLSHKKKITQKQAWKLIMATTCILVFSYNAFSYDLFNYIFDARIITHYHQNPYQHKALDYPGDPMLSFMHWTQRLYPYGPTWLVLTVPLSFLGFGYFLPTFFLFKILMASSYYGSVYFIGKILKKYKPTQEVFGIIFFGLAPLVIIEALVSAHIDIVMMFFALFAFYLLLMNKNLYSGLLLLFSIGIKFATGFLLPVMAYIHVKRQHVRAQWFSIQLVNVLLMVLTVIIASYRTNFQPWYLLGVLSFAVFISDNVYILISSLIISFFALLTYVPFLYTGNWNPPIPHILWWIYLSSYIVMFITLLIVFILKRQKHTTQQ